ncbi:MAG: lipoyl synthase [Candidatus Omnitrophota bacterium]|nr:MAG: lipoyl synthase [Candidatus Omnitrophota bacterium]
MKKPVWLNKKINLSGCRQMKQLSKELNLYTVCEEAFCPNICECFYEQVATFMILGNICTRNCKFCAITKGIPQKVDINEPARIKEAVKKLNLKYVVITSPTRDDLDDGGAGIFCQTVKEVKSLSFSPKVELLIPDFAGNISSLREISVCGADVISHNLETVPSLYPEVRNSADYNRSLGILRIIKSINNKVFTKSGIMLGLGEKRQEIINVLEDLRKANCDFLTLGQYLPPSLSSLAVKEYVSLEKFKYLEKEALKIGFKEIKSSPYTRSSYLAHTFLKEETRSK